ncbi:MAG: SDR family NAD(P)-dependent oxidoreductase, partial [Hyphomonadaceae bacterium]
MEAAPLDAVALVAGAASPLGMAVARRLAARASGGLVLVDRDAAGLEAAADRLPDPPERVSTLPIDIADKAGWEAVRDFIAAHYGRLDWAAAHIGAAPADSQSADPADWRRATGQQLEGAFLILRTLTPFMRANTDGGAIVLIAADAAHYAVPALAAQGVSTAGLLQLMRVAAREGAADGVRVNAIAPGGPETALWRDAPMLIDLARAAGGAEAALR